MARRRGFLAEMQHQARLAEQRQRAAERQQQTHIRQVEQAQRAAQRASLAASRASEADRKRLEKEAAAAHIAAMQAEVDELNAELRYKYSEIDGLLTATLDVDDFVDLERLRVQVQHPPFPRADLRVAFPVPAPIPDPPMPVRAEPEAPSGMFGKKRKAAEAEAAVEKQYAADYYAWRSATDILPQRRAAQAESYAAAEKQRQDALAREEARYEKESASREADAAAQNSELDDLISGLGYGTVDAVQDYVGIVLANSIYPEWFPITHTSSFDPSTAELDLRVLIPGPKEVPEIKAYKYVKATDEIATTPLTQKDLKDRYAGVVHNVALRSLHEIFEADRRELIQTISLELGTETVNPATGRDTYVAFVAVAVSREQFTELDLSGVVPSATLEHLQGVVSKNPYALAAVDGSGVRRA
jgi:restriction system protein